MQTLKRMLDNITSDKSIAMVPATPDILDTTIARLIVEWYMANNFESLERDENILTWYKNKPAVNVAFHLWNAWQEFKKPHGA